MNTYVTKRRPWLWASRQWLLLLGLMFLTANVFGQARNYQFERSTAAYTEITGGTNSTATGDDGTEVVPLPFPFTYAGAPVTEITIGTNGFVRMSGGAIFGSNWVNALTSTASLPVLAPFWDDNNRGTGGIFYATSGTAPNREMAIEYRGILTSGSGSSTSTSRARFKVILKEGSNEIVFHYGSSSVTTSGLSGSIGLNSAPGGAGQFLSVTPGANPTVSTTVENGTIVNLPDSGVVYTFTPNVAACAMPWAIVSSAPTAGGFSINWRNVGAASYQYAAVTSATLPTGAGTTVTDTFATVTGLLPNTPYYVYVRAACAGGATSAWAGPVLVNTGGPVSSIGSGLWSNPAIWSIGSVPSSASDVTISANDSVILDVTTVVNSLNVNGVLGVNASAQRILSVVGAANVAASGSINFGVPTTGTSIRALEFRGAFNHAGNSNFANGNAVWIFSGTAAQTINQTGTLVNSAVGQIQVSNAAGLTLASPLTVGFDVTLVAGAFNVGNNLTIDMATVNSTASQVRRSPYGNFVGTPTVASTVYNLSYVFFTGQTTDLITEGSEMPASRTISTLTVSNPAGLIMNGNVTLTAATSALTLTNGIITLPAGGKIISTASGFAPTVGSATSFVLGGFEINPNVTAATTRNIPIGSVVNGIPVRGHLVLAGLNTAGTAQTITVMPVGAPSGSTVAPLTSVLGQRAFQITATGPIGTAATVALNWDLLEAQTFVSTLANIRIAQGTSLTGPWTARSASSTAGSLTGTGTRTSTAIDLANGNFFAWGTVAANDIAVTQLVRPISGECFGQAETVVAVIRNEGPTIDRATTPITIKGTVTTPAGTVINLTNVVRNSGTFALGSTDTITFTSTVNLVDSGNYVVRIFADSLTASIRTNDTLTRTVRSDAWTARANPAQIVTSQSSTVEVLRNGVPAANAGVFPRNQAIVRISEMVAFRTGVGAQPVFPAYIPAAAQDFLEITNFGDTAANVGGWNVEIFGVGARAYTFPANVVIPARGVLVLHIGPGTDDPANRYYNTGGTNDAISSTSLWGVTLRNGTTMIDAVAFRGYVFPAAAGVTAADWSGNSSTTSSAGMMLVNFDNNNAANWVISTATLFTNIGDFNPNMSFAQRTVSWTGPGGFNATGPTAPTGVRNTAAVEQYTATITAAGSCVRTATASLQVVQPITPVAGFTISNTTATTGGVISTVTLTDTSLNIPFQRRWTITPNTVTFVNNTNDSSAAPQVQFTAVGTYSVKLVVSNPAGADSVTQANAITVTLGYCASNATNTADSKIDSVVIGNTITGSAQTTCETYTNNTTLGVAGTIIKGQGNVIQVKSGYCGTSSYNALGKVFVDGNKNGVFEANEEVATFGPLAATGSGAAREWFNVNLYVPGTADTGVTRMRIIWQETSSLSSIVGCGTYTYGETEDYNISLVNPATAAQPVLVSPANNAFVNVNGPASSTATISWRPAIPFNGTQQSAVRYDWQLASRAAGNFNTPLLTLASGNSGADTALTLNFQQLDAALSNLSVAVGDTVRGIWRVRAIAGNDTVFSFQTWNVDIRRGTVTDALSAFNLLTPPNGTILPVEGPGSQSATISWNRSIEGNSIPVTYEWLAIAPGGSFNNPTVALPAGNSGADTSLTLSFNQIDALLASLGFNVGDSAILDWTVRATAGSFNRLSTDTWRVRLFRGGIAPVRLVVAPPATGTSATGTRGPSGAAGQAFLRMAMIVTRAELAAVGIDSGAALTRVALRQAIAANVAVRGLLTLRAINAPASTVAYSRGTDWSNIIQGMSVVFNDSISVRTTVGLQNLPFSQPFIYTGGAIELALDWASTAPFATTTGGYAASTTVAQGSVAAQGATAPTTLLTTNAQFRPELTWTVDDRKANELEVVTMFARGSNPRQWGSPEVIQAVVRNNGYRVGTNVPVTLTVAGANTFTNTQTIPTLGIDSVTTVTFAAFTGTNLGFNNMSVSVPADNVPANNAKTWAQQQTDSIFSYNDTVTTGLGAVGYNTGSGLLLARFSINGNRSIRAARMRIGAAPEIVGNALRAVVTNDSGVIVAQSAPITITTAQLNTWVVFPFPNPVNINNGNFFIGMAQPANTTGYFPMAFQAETPTRANAYFTAPLAGGVVPSPVANFRLLIEAHVGAPVIPVDSLSRFSLVSPNNNTTLTLSGDATQTVTIRWNRSVRSVGTTPVTYRWLLDVPGTNFSNPVVTVNAGTDTSLTLTYGQIVDTLASRGIQVGQSFTGRWSVRASSDSLNRLATLPFNLTLTRGVMSSIEETEFSKSIMLYPNPAAYTAKLQVRGSDKDLMITVVNAVGQEMKKFTVNGGVRSDIEIDLANLNEGLYFVRISDGSNLAIKRLMIQR